MLNRTIAENLKIGAPEATDEQLHEALFCAGLEGMKEDYLDQTSSGSGGQKQRLGVARALLHEADEFVFDEFTSESTKLPRDRCWKEWAFGSTVKRRSSSHTGTVPSEMLIA
jgi:ABC-type proline/glycine betaine transport system ATPase subunit